MPRYYFHFRRGEVLQIDEEGLDLPDLPAAKHEAILSIRELLCGAIKAGKNSMPDALVIADEAGRVRHSTISVGHTSPLLNQRDGPSPG